MNITSFEIWLDGTCILMSQNASGEFRFSQLDTPGSYVVRIVPVEFAERKSYK